MVVGASAEECGVHSGPDGDLTLGGALFAAAQTPSVALTWPGADAHPKFPPSTVTRIVAARAPPTEERLMRTSCLKMLVVFVLAGGLGACDPASNQDPRVSQDLRLSRAPAFSVSTAGSGGALVLRFSTRSFILVFDADRQLLSAHMPSNICGDGALNVVEVQRVVTPSELGQVVAQVTGDEQVAVYHAASPADAGLAAPIDFFGFANVVDFGAFCRFLAGPNRIAGGVVQRLSTFSAASFHARWTGTIEGVNGGDYHLTEIYQLNADAHDPSNPDTFVQEVSSILLTPLP